MWWRGFFGHTEKAIKIKEENRWPKKNSPVEGSHIMMFARSIADDNQVYYDADYAKSTEAGGGYRTPDICAVFRSI